MTSALPFLEFCQWLDARLVAWSLERLKDGSLVIEGISLDGDVVRVVSGEFWNLEAQINEAVLLVAKEIGVES
jgi:hypothetical protein